MIALALDTSSDLAGVGLFEDAALIGEVTWRTHRSHSRELLPTVDWLMKSRGLDKSRLGAIYVCVGPGSYAGLRVGISTAKALAYALGIAIVGVGRLSADAEPHALENGPVVYAVQAAGRAELAWAVYQRQDSSLVEVGSPRLSREPELIESIDQLSIACGELSPALIEALTAKGVAISRDSFNRVGAIGRLGARRLEIGEVDDADSLVPMYLREPAIGPQPPVSA